MNVCFAPPGTRVAWLIGGHLVVGYRATAEEFAEGTGLDVSHIDGLGFLRESRITTGRNTEANYGWFCCQLDDVKGESLFDH